MWEQDKTDCPLVTGILVRALVDHSNGFLLTASTIAKPELGRRNLENMMQSLESLSLWPFIHVLAWTPETTARFIRAAQADLLKPGLRLYVRVYGSHVRHVVIVLTPVQGIRCLGAGRAAAEGEGSKLLCLFILVCDAE